VNLERRHTRDADPSVQRRGGKTALTSWPVRSSRSNGNKAQLERTSMIREFGENDIQVL
jgi:hypothetical protein